MTDAPRFANVPLPRRCRRETAPRTNCKPRCACNTTGGKTAGVTPYTSSGLVLSPILSIRTPAFSRIVNSRFDIGVSSV
jgi:hypothetical protein